MLLLRFTIHLNIKNEMIHNYKPKKTRESLHKEWIILISFNNNIMNKINKYYSIIITLIHYE